MNVLKHYRPQSHLFASPLGTLLGQGCVKRVLCSNQEQQLGLQAETLLQQHPKTPLIFGLIPFNTNQPAQLIVPQSVTRLMQQQPFSSRQDSKANPITHLRASPPAAQFEQWVQHAVELLHQQPLLKKLVLARHLELELSQGLNRSALLEALWSQNTQGYTYSFALDDSPDPATFLGASPELLLRKQGEQVYLNPLAGTALRQPNNPAADQAIAQQLLHSSKDRAEHAFVIENILAALAPFCEELDAATTPSLVSTATLWHLSTEIHGRLKAPYTNALHLTLAVHPTPAVCGHPTLLARDYIEQIENIDRGFFAGAVGWMDQAGDGEWAVAIRCAYYKQKKLLLSAGAGIVLDSTPISERIETGNKLRTLLNALQADPELIQEGITQ